MCSFRLQIKLFTISLIPSAEQVSEHFDVIVIGIEQNRECFFILAFVCVLFRNYRQATKNPSTFSRVSSIYLSIKFQFCHRSGNKSLITFSVLLNICWWICIRAMCLCLCIGVRVWYPSIFANNNINWNYWMVAVFRMFFMKWAR